MSQFEFTIPPFPHYLYCGQDTYNKGGGHPNRKNIGVFDLLFVTEGTLYIGEEDLDWSINAGECLLLRPDRYHYTKKACDVKTHFYWLHFQTNGMWTESIDSRQHVGNDQITPFYLNERFALTLSRYIQLKNSISTYEKLMKLIVLIREPSISSRWEEQTIFHQILQDLHYSQLPNVHSSIKDISERCALFLQQNFDQKITNESISDALNFHYAYIARCMKKVFGCTPLEYLIKYRIAQAKILIVNTNLSIGAIAEKTGFSNSSYFTRCFVKEENYPPLKFRKISR